MEKRDIDKSIADVKKSYVVFLLMMGVLTFAVLFFLFTRLSITNFLKGYVSNSSPIQLFENYFADGFLVFSVVLFIICFCVFRRLVMTRQIQCIIYENKSAEQDLELTRVKNKYNSIMLLVSLIALNLCFYLFKSYYSVFENLIIFVGVHIFATFFILFNGIRKKCSIILIMENDENMLRYATRKIIKTKFNQRLFVIIMVEIAIAILALYFLFTETFTLMQIFVIVFVPVVVGYLGVIFNIVNRIKELRLIDQRQGEWYYETSKKILKKERLNIYNLFLYINLIYLFYEFAQLVSSNNDSYNAILAGIIFVVNVFSFVLGQIYVVRNKRTCVWKDGVTVEENKDNQKNNQNKNYNILPR